MPSSDMSPEKARVKDLVLTENTDDFIIGDRVWVNGTKPGYIQYLGETRFGPGEWAGVVLDDHSGKNDGSVSGIRYFQCEPKRGVFARLYKLTRYPLTPSPSGSSPTPSGRAVSPFGGSGCGSNGGRSGSNSPLPLRSTSPGGMLAGKMGPPKVGDRVLVNASGGPKPGTLRFLGTTDFAAGEWAGVELDVPTGKNDGTVAGKKYFECGTNYGLFAPAHKVTRATGSVASRRYQHLQLGSQESLNSSLSSSTTPGGGRAKSDRLRGKGANEGEEEIRKRKLTGESTSSVDQQLSDRDLEREVVVKAATQLEQVESELTQLQSEHRRYVDESERRVNRLRQLLDVAEGERRNLAAKLQDEKRRVEDLQFRVDEECISKDDLEAQTKKEQIRLQEMESELEQERLKNKALSEGKSLDSAMSDLLKKQTQEAHSLREQLRESQSKVHELMRQNQQRSKSPPATLRTWGSRSLEEEITKKEEHLLQLEVTLDNKKRELQSMHSRIAEMEKELEKYKARHEKHLETIDSLNIKVQKLESQCATINESYHQAKQDLTDIDARLTTSEERCRELERERDSLRERSNEHLTNDELSASLNQELKQKDKRLAELERRLEEVSTRRREEEGRSKEEHRNAIRTMTVEYQEELKIWSIKCERLEHELELAKEEQKLSLRKVTAVKEEIEEKFRREMDRKESQLKRAETRMQEIQHSLDEISRLKEQLDRVQADRDRLRSEKEEIRRRMESAEDRRKRSEEEREAHVAMLKSEVQRLRTEFATHREDLAKRLAETQYDTRMAEELQEQILTQRRVLEEVQRRLRETQGERDELNNELSLAKSNQAQQQQQLESKNSTLHHEIDMLKKRNDEAIEEIQSLKRSLEAAQILEEQKQEQIDAKHSELSRLRSELRDKASEEKIFDKERSHMENKIGELQAELDKIRSKITVPDSEYQQVQGERDAMENQVEFLNKVIVDMQQKNDDLRGRLEILETEVIFDGNLQLGNNNSHDHTPPIPYRRSSSHLFCDLCDAYGIHDTDQCPKKELAGLLSPTISLSICEESEMF